MFRSGSKANEINVRERERGRETTQKGENPFFQQQQNRMKDFMLRMFLLSDNTLFSIYLSFQCTSINNDLNECSIKKIIDAMHTDANHIALRLRSRHFGRCKALLSLLFAYNVMQDVLRGCKKCDKLVDTAYSYTHKCI